MSDPIPKVTSTDVFQAARLTRALIAYVTEQAREHHLSEAAVVGALATGLSFVAAGVVAGNDYEPMSYEAFIMRHVSRVFRSELRRPQYTRH